MQVLSILLKTHIPVITLRIPCYLFLAFVDLKSWMSNTWHQTVQAKFSLLNEPTWGTHSYITNLIIIIIWQKTHIYWSGSKDERKETKGFIWITVKGRWKCPFLSSYLTFSVFLISWGCGLQRFAYLERYKAVS